ISVLRHSVSPAFFRFANCGPLNLRQKVQHGAQPKAEHGVENEDYHGAEQNNHQHHNGVVDDLLFVRPDNLLHLASRIAEKLRNIFEKALDTGEKALLFLSFFCHVGSAFLTLSRGGAYACGRSGNTSSSRACRGCSFCSSWCCSCAVCTPCRRA